jgi:hypothetical protein
MTIQTNPDSNNVTPSVTTREAHQTATTSKEQNTVREGAITDIFGPPIYTYSRAQAIDDGFLVDVSVTAQEAGFRIPVALTLAVWADCVAWNAADNQRQTYQDEAGRAWDVLYMAAQAARKGNGERVAFQIYRLPRGGRGIRPRLTTLHMVIGPGDDGEPVITVMLPGED